MTWRALPSHAAAQKWKELHSGERTERDQHQRQEVELVVADPVAGGGTTVGRSCRRYAPAPTPGHQPQAPVAVTVNAMRAAASVRAVVPVADEQEGREAGEPQNTTSCTRLPDSTTPASSP